MAGNARAELAVWLGVLVIIAVLSTLAFVQGDIRLGVVILVTSLTIVVNIVRLIRRSRASGRTDVEDQ